MQKKIEQSLPSTVKKFITGNYLLIAILSLASFLRLYRITYLLGFWYDQGRDALVIWDLIHKAKFFLIGPTTGIEGVFRGPWYYWLITPFYWIGKGNPVYPAVFLAFTSILAIGFIYYLGNKIGGKITGILAAIISSFSFYIIYASRWLSNPTPMLLLSMVMIWAMFKVVEGKKWGWPVISFCAGLSLFNFGSSGELFYFPILLIFIIWQRRNWPDLKNLFLSFFMFIITFAPLLIFDFKHQRILSNNLRKSFVSEKSFTLPTAQFIEKRTLFYYDVFTRKIFDSRGPKEKIILTVAAVWFIISLPKYVRNKKTLIVILLMTAPMAGLYFYQGNNTTLYDYYFTGYYLIFILLFAVVLGDIWRFWIGKIFVLYFIFLFLNSNMSIVLPRLTDKSDGPESIVLGNQIKAVDWVYKNAGGRDFNVDVYVPPVIPYAYNYLFIWIGTNKYNKLPKETQVSLLYTLYEADSAHPDLFRSWVDRQKRIGRIQKEQRFGGITVQERQRILVE